MAIIESLTADEIIARLGDKVSSEALSLALGLMAPLADPALTGNPTAPTPATADNDTSIATTAFVKAQGYAPLASPALTGNPTAPTPATSDNDTSIATTAFVKAALALLVDSSPATLDTLNELAAALGDDPNFATTMTTALGLKAPLASPTFTGDPKAPTPATGDNDTSIATTAFVKAQGYSPLASPTFTGDPKAPTPATGDNDTSIATTAFVKAQGYAPLASPALTGTPTAPTPAANDNDTSIATSAFVTERAARYAAVFSSAATDRTAALTEVGNLVILTAAAAKTQRLPDDATANFGIGAWVDYVSTGAGEITFVGAGSATVVSADLTAPQYIVARAIKIAANSWLLVKQPDTSGSGTGMVAYANVAALDAETETVFGTVLPTTNWGTYTGISQLNGYTGEALVETVSTIRSGIVEITQTLTVGRLNAGYNSRIQRTKSGLGSWTAWGWGDLVPMPTADWQVANKLYVDAHSLLVIPWADLDTLNGNNSSTGMVTVTGDDLGVLTGIAKYNAYPGGSLRFENNAAYSDVDYHRAQMQRVWVPNNDGTLDEIRRFRNDLPSWSFNAWTAWEIFVPQPTGLLPYPPITAGAASVWWAGPAKSGTRAIGVNLDLRTLVIGRRVRLTGFRIEVSTLAAGVTASFGLYGTTDGTDPDGGALIATLLSNVDCSTTGNKQVTGLAIDLEPGLYWIGFTASASGAVLSGVTNSTDPLNGMFFPHREGSQGRIGGMTAQLNQNGVLPSTLDMADTWDTNANAIWYGLQTALIP